MCVFPAHGIRVQTICMVRLLPVIRCFRHAWSLHAQGYDSLNSIKHVDDPFFTRKEKEEEEEGTEMIKHMATNMFYQLLFHMLFLCKHKW